MKKLALICLGLVVVSASAWAIDNLNRTKGASLVQGGTSDTNGSTVIESSSSTNIYKQVVITATVSGTQTSSTNTFATAFLATPTVVRGYVSGKDGAWGNASVVTPSTTTLIVTALSTNSTMTNSLPFIVYGTVRTGKFE